MSANNVQSEREIRLIKALCREIELVCQCPTAVPKSRLQLLEFLGCLEDAIRFERSLSYPPAQHLLEGRFDGQSTNDTVANDEDKDLLLFREAIDLVPLGGGAQMYSDFGDPPKS